MTNNPKTMTEIRDHSAYQYSLHEKSQYDFLQGWDSRDKLDDEALKVAVEALEKIRIDIRYAINNGQFGGPANFVLSSKEIDCDVALANIRELRGEK